MQNFESNKEFPQIFIEIFNLKTSLNFNEFVDNVLDEKLNFGVDKNLYQSFLYKLLKLIQINIDDIVFQNF